MLCAFFNGNTAPRYFFLTFHTSYYYILIIKYLTMTNYCKTLESKIKSYMTYMHTFGCHLRQITSLKEDMKVFYVLHVVQLFAISSDSFVFTVIIIRMPEIKCSSRHPLHKVKLQLSKNPQQNISWCFQGR